VDAAKMPVVATPSAPIEAKISTESSPRLMEDVKKVAETSFPKLEASHADSKVRCLVFLEAILAERESIGDFGCL
jgi:hypothetical protein